MLAAVLPDSPAVVVLDEVPWLAEQDDIFDGALQAAWDQGSAAQVPGFEPAESAFIGVSASGFTDVAAAGLALRWRPEEVVGAFA